MKKKLLIISLLFVVACFGGKNIVNNSVTVDYNDFLNYIKIKYNNIYSKIKLNDKNIIKGKISYFIQNDSLFIISNSKNIIKISLDTQNIEWIKELATVPYNNFVFNKDNICFNGTDNNFYILDYDSGNIKGMFFNTSINTIFNIKQPHIYKDYIVAFFANNEIFIINNLTNKVVKTIEYDNIDIRDNLIIIDNNKTIDLNNLGGK